MYILFRINARKKKKKQLFYFKNVIKNNPTVFESNIFFIVFQTHARAYSSVFNRIRTPTIEHQNGITHGYTKTEIYL